VRIGSVPVVLFILPIVLAEAFAIVVNKGPFFAPWPATQTRTMMPPTQAVGRGRP
jgi:hypothetical protein